MAPKPNRNALKRPQQIRQSHPDVEKSWYGKAEFWTAVGTIFLVIVGIWGVFETKRSLELSERAWLGPNALPVVSSPIEGQPLSYKVNYINTGKEPATNLAFSTDAGIIPAPENGDFNHIAVQRDLTCNNLNPSEEGPYVLPGASMQQGTATNLGYHPIVATKDVNVGKSYIYVQGCVAYRTFGKDHHSSYCSVLIIQPGIPSATGDDAEGQGDLKKRKTLVPLGASGADVRRLDLIGCPGSKAD